MPKASPTVPVCGVDVAGGRPTSASTLSHARFFAAQPLPNGPPSKLGRASGSYGLVRDRWPSCRLRRAAQGRTRPEESIDVLESVYPNQTEDGSI